MKRNFVSFDVFDTCLVRRCGMPYKIWDIMADELFEKDDDCGRLSFVGNRQVAEKKLMDENPYPTLEDIYQEMDSFKWGRSLGELMRLEMDVEKRELFPNPKMLEIVQQHRIAGDKICFISDMYLPSSFIKKILVKYGFCKENEQVFVSAECRASKDDGKIFDFVFEKTGTKAKQWIHYGDNEKSDYLKPISKGIKANWVTNTSFTSEEERWISEARFYAHKHEIELWSGLCRYARLSLDGSEKSERAVDLISSLYVPYVDFVLRKCQEKQIRSIYFLARDAHVFLTIAKQLKQKYPNVLLHYLKLSRRSLYPCAFFEVNDYEMKLTVGQCVAQTVEKAVKSIGLAWDDLSDVTKKTYRASYILTSPEKAMAFGRFLENNERSLILEKSKQYRRVFLQYLNQESFLENESKAIVDLGWAGSGRCIINYILTNLQKSVTSTFYWGSCLSLMKGNFSDKLYVFQQQYDISSYSSGAMLFLEQYASVNVDGTTIGYLEENNLVKPVELATNKVDKGLVEKNTRSVAAVAKAFLCTNLCPESLQDIFLCCGLKQLQNLQDNPSSKDLKFYSFIETENYGKVIKLAQRLTLKNFLALLVWGIPAHPQWQAAAIKKTFGPFAGVYKKIYEYSSKTSFARFLRKWWNR